MNNYRNLNVWKKAIELTTIVYSAVADFPNEEKYGIISQIKRSVVSIPSNIAEGAGRNSKKEFNYFLGIANGSSYELQTLIILSNNLKMIDQEKTENILSNIDEIQKMLFNLQNHLNNSN
jgi:four helix bundle protein